MSKTQINSIISRLEKLEAEVFTSHGTSLPKTSRSQKAIVPPDLNFSINERAFVNRYVAGKSGPKRFTLLLAYLAKGKEGSEVAMVDLKKAWKNMSGKSLLGKFNGYYPNKAKDWGWVDTPKHGHYALTNEWRTCYAE